MWRNSAHRTAQHRQNPAIGNAREFHLPARGPWSDFDLRHEKNSYCRDEYFARALVEVFITYLGGGCPSFLFLFGLFAACCGKWGWYTRGLRWRGSARTRDLLFPLFSPHWSRTTNRTEILVFVALSSSRCFALSRLGKAVAMVLYAGSWYKTTLLNLSNPLFSLYMTLTARNLYEKKKLTETCQEKKSDQTLPKVSEKTRKKKKRNPSCASHNQKKNSLTCSL